ncbi:32305_t:CDS:2, partial [Racocetra persica]
NVKYCNTWCPDCAHSRPLILEEAKQIAHSRNVGAYIVRVQKRLTLEEAKQIAHSRNGECLSEIFVNIRSPLLWKCAKGHKWHSTLKIVKNSNSWCPFPDKNCWPGFLKTSKYPTGLELDIPYYHYGFAIEVQGEQHEKYNEFFHKGDPNNFIKQKERDQLKKELCEENWIVLRKHLRENYNHMCIFITLLN